MTDMRDNDVAPYRKKSKKSVPKKSNHKHIYEPVILEYWNPQFKFDHRGFVGGVDKYPGSRCNVCGKLATGFPKGSVEEEKMTAHYGVAFSRRDVLNSPEFTYLDVCNVNNIWDL